MSKQTVLSALTMAARELEVARVESPRLTSELLLGFVLGWSRIQTLTYPQAGIDPDSFERFIGLVRRRSAGEPLQYITGEQEFYGLGFRVTPGVLIPRPETELLIEAALELAAGCSSQVSFIDVGTGSGCIAVSFASHSPSSTGWAVDVSLEALTVARENAARHGVQDRIQFVCGDLLQCFRISSEFDFVFSNPPYIAETEYRLLSPHVRDHEPRLALLGGETGVEPLIRLIPQAGPRLKPGGCLLVEAGAGQSGAICELLHTGGLRVERILDDLQGIPRCIIARKDPKETHG